MTDAGISLGRVGACGRIRSYKQRASRLLFLAGRRHGASRLQYHGAALPAAP